MLHTCTNHIKFLGLHVGKRTFLAIFGLLILICLALLQSTVTVFVSPSSRLHYVRKTTPTLKKTIFVFWQLAYDTHEFCYMTSFSK